MQILPLGSSNADLYVDDVRMFNVGALTITAAAGNPSAATVAPDAANVPMLRIGVTETGGHEDVLVTQVVLNASGTADDRSAASGGDINNNQVCLYNDAGTTAGAWDASDTLIACTNYAADNGSVTFSGINETITAGTTENWLLVYRQLAGTASTGETFVASIAPVSGITANTVSSSATNFTITPVIAGSAITGNTMTVDGNPPAQSNWSPAKGATICNTDPNVTLTLDETGDCKWSLTDAAYGAMAGDCTGGGTTSITCAVSGLATGANTVYVACRDTIGNANTAANNEHINYTVSAGVPDQSGWNPADGATVCSSTPIDFNLNKAGDCKWSLTDAAYGAMAGDCTGDGTTSITCTTSGLPASAATVYLSCADLCGNADTAATNDSLSYTVDDGVPSKSGFSPASGSGITTNAPTITFTTNKNSDCRWSLTDAAYSSMTNDCTGDGTTSITCSASGLPEGAAVVYIACSDACGNADTATTNAELSYTVDTQPPARSSVSPATGSTVYTTSPVITFATNENAWCRWSLTDAAYDAMTNDCTGGGTVSQTCATGGLSWGSGQNIYISCRDTLNNMDTAATNENLTYTCTKPTVTIAAANSQPSSAMVDSVNKLMGAFSFKTDVGTADVTSITLSEVGSVAAATYLSGVKLWYDTDGTFDGNETQFGAAAAFNSSEKATFTGALSVYSTQTVYVYVTLNVGGGAIAGRLIDLEINSAADAVAANGTIAGTFPVNLPGTTVIVGGQAVSLTVTPDSAELEVGATLQFFVSGKDVYGNTTSNLGTVTWSIDTQIGAMNPSTGMLTATSVGTGIVTAASSVGPTDSTGVIKVVGTIPNGSYAYRKQLTVKNSVSTVLPKGYSVEFNMDHATCYGSGTGKCSFAGGKDVRVFYYNGEDYIPLNRVNEPGCEGDNVGCTGESGGYTPWNDSNTEIWFPTYIEIPGGGSDSNYWLYYGNPDAGAPPEDPNSVYVWHDDFTTDSMSRYTIGKSLDIHGDNSSLIVYDATNGRITFDCGDNCGAGIRLTGIDLADVLVQADEYVDKTYPYSGTTNFTLRWKSNVSAFYAHMSNNLRVKYTSTSGDCTTGAVTCDGTQGYNSPCIGRADLAERNCQVSGIPAVKTYFPPAFCGDPPVIRRFRYGIYRSSHYFWYHKRTNYTADQSGTDWSFTSGQIGLQANQQRGWFDNLLVRYFVSPEPTLTLGTEQTRPDYKVEGMHPYITQVSQGEQNAQMLRLAVSTAAPENLTQIVLKSKNSADSDVTGVTIYYTGTSKSFETSTPFGTPNTPFAGGVATFDDTLALPSNSVVYFFVVYNISPVAQTGNVLDVRIDAGGIVTSGGAYPGTVTIDPAGQRTIAPPQTLGRIIVVNSTTANVRPGDKDQQVLRIDFPVSGVGSPQTLQSITITSKNISDTDVSGVSAYYTGTLPFFNTGTPFGTTHQPFGGGEVTFTGSLDFETKNTTHSIFIAFDIADTAVSGHTIDAQVLANNIKIEGVLRSPGIGDPAGSRKIYLPSGAVTGLAPCHMLVDSNPSFMSIFVASYYSTTTNQGSCSVTNDTIGDLAASDTKYAGLSMKDIEKFDPQQEWVEFWYNLSAYGITGRAINSLAFNAEMYLVGVESGSAPVTNPADWNTIYESRVQLFNFTTGLWEDMGPQFLTPTASGWRTAGTEAYLWDETSDTHPEKPLIRSKTSSFSDAYMNSSGLLKVRVWIKGALNTNFDESSMVFNTALLNINYGSTLEQADWRWLDATESPVAVENKYINTQKNAQLHLRAGVRSNFAQRGAHYLGLQYDTASGFTAPVLITGSSTAMQYWNDTDPDHLKGDPVAIHFLSAATDSGIYHEDSLPPAEAKDSSVMYEEDFTVSPLNTGTYYIRVVELNADGTFKSALDSYAVPAKLIVESTSAAVTAYNWMQNTSPYTTTGANTPLEFVVNTNYIVAVRVEGKAATSYTWRLEYQRNPYTNPGDWTPVTLTCSTCDWISMNGAWGADEGAVATGGFVTGAGTGTVLAGRYDESGAFGSTFALAANQYTEFWWSVKPTSYAAGNSYRFRVTNAGSTSLISYQSLPEARQTTREQVNYRWADENESSVAPENTAAGVAVNQPLHLRVAVRGNNNEWAAHRIALQYDTDSSFPSPSLVTVSSSPVAEWDDTDHNAGDAVSGAKMLSGNPYDGVYHENNVQTAAQDYLRDIMYEEDFTVAVTSAGTYYLRVVSVDAAGGNPQPLDVYSKTIAVNAAIPTNYQTFFAWAADASSPQFQPTNNLLAYAPGNLYLLAAQTQNQGSAASVYNWQLQYKRTSGTPGDWTNVTAASADWKAANCTYGVDGKTIPQTVFATNGGVGIGAAETGYYSERGTITDSLGAGSYTEYWYCLTPTSQAAKSTYDFRLTNTGSTSGFIYSVYPQAAEPMSEMTAFRWADAGEAALDVENVGIIAASGDKLHVRIGIRGNYGAYAAHRLGLQYDTSIAFTAPVLLTASSSALKSWDDTDHSNGDEVSGLKMLGGASGNGLYHEDNTPFVETSRADVTYEEDFTIQPVSLGSYYIRVVELDESGNFLRALDKYSEIAEINISTPIDYQTKYNWSVNAASPAWNGQNATLDFTTEVNYIIAVKIENNSSLNTNYDWQLQYQSDPYGTPGDWTNVTTTSAGWSAVDGAWGADGAAVGTGVFATTGYTNCTGCTVVNGVYSETGKAASFSLAAMKYTEIWYSVRGNASTFGNAYRFRVTNTGSTYGMSYLTYPECRIVARQQVSYRWTDQDEAAIELENTPAYAVVNDTLHLRVGVRSRNAAWNGHKLAVQYDTDAAFSSPVLLTDATPVRGWDDPDHTEGDLMTAAHILSGTPSDGIYHEDNNQPATQDKSMNILYEEDFTVRPGVTGTYYFRAVEVDNAGDNPQPLGIYTQTAALYVVVPNNHQAAYNWSENLAAPVFGGAGVPAGMTNGVTYILAVRVEHTDPAVPFNWRLQYQKDPEGTPGPWTDLTLFSTDWKAVDGAWGADGATVTTAAFVTGYTGVASAVNGRYSETGLVSSYMLSGETYTEFWFSVKPQPSAMNYDYRFRLTNSGQTTGFRYDVYPEAKHPPTTGTIAITELMNCCTEDTTPELTLTCEDPAGTNCNAADSMRFSCNNANWSAWMPFSKTTSAFDITTGAGCGAADGEKTVYVEYKNEYNAIQTLHASDKTVFDTTAPEIVNVPNVQSIMGNDCPLHGTTDGVVCGDPSQDPICTVWYQSRPSSSYSLFPGAPNQFTVVVNWTDNMQSYGSQWKLQGDAAFGDAIQTPDTETPWQQFYNIDAGDVTPDQTVRFTVYDKVGHNDYVNIKFSNDNMNPDNPTVSGFASSSKAIGLTNGDWYPYDNPYFEWPVPNDNPVGHSVGIEGYYVSFSTNPSVIPAAFQKNNYFDSSVALSCGSTYYLRVRTRDHVCNVQDPVTTFVYNYDNNKPTIVNNMSGCPTCDNTWRNASGTAYDVDFTDTCGDLKRAEYMVYTGPGQTGTQVLGWTTIADNINFPTYTNDWQIDYASLSEGMNYVTVRLTDEAGNVTTSVDSFYVRKDTVPPAIVYNTPITAGGYTPWYSANVANDIDLIWTSDSPLAQFDYKIGEGAWTNIWTGSQAASYTTDWTIAWASLPQGETRIGVRGLDAAGNWRTDDFATGTAGFIFRKDSIPPDNPTTPVNGWSDYAKADTITSGGAYSYASPYFEWATPSDYPQPVNSGVAGYYVGFSTDPSLDPMVFQTAATYTAAAMVCNADYYLRIKTRDSAVSPNVTFSAVTAFVYRWAGQIDVSDNQTGDDTWRNANTGVYDVDFAGGCTSSLDTVEYALWTAEDADTGTGTQVVPWTVLIGPNYGSHAYTADWSISNAAFAAATDGINFVSIRVTDMNGLVTIYKDAFYILKDTLAPEIPSATSFDSTTKNAVLTSNNWYNHPAPYFEWSAGSDLPAAPALSSGFNEFVVYFGTDPAGVPANATTAQSYVPSSALESGWTYYLRISTRDNVGNTSAASTVFTYRYDSTAPDGVTASAFDSSAKNVTLASGNWYSYPQPYFEWSAASDLPVTPANSGLKEYKVYFGTDPAGVPTAAAKAQSFVPAQPLVSGWDYYLRIAATDNAENEGAAVTSFTYRYDSTAPETPVVPVLGWASDSKLMPIVNGGSYTSVHPYFEWAAPSDLPGTPANAGLDGYYVIFSTDPAAVPTTFQNANSFTATTPTCNATYTLRISTRDLSYPPNVSAPVSAFTYYKRGSVTIVDNQPNDDVWHNAAGALYDVDFYTDCDNLDYAQYTFWSAEGMSAGTGTEVMPWKTFIGPGAGVSVYTADWQIAAADFADAQEGINWVSIRAVCTSGLTETLTDAFYFRKDVTPPQVPMSAITESSDYLWMSPANGRLYYGAGMSGAEPFTVSGTASDALSGLNRVTFSNAFGESPANAADPAAWSATYDIDSTNTTADVVTVTAYDNAGNATFIQFITERNNKLSIQYLTMTPAWLPSFVEFKIFYPDGVTEMTTTGADGLYTQVTGGVDTSNFVRGYDRNGLSVGAFDDQADSTADGLVVSRLEYLTGAGDMCGAIPGAGAWCLEMYAAGCVSSVNPHYAGVFANNIRTDGFYATLDEELTIGGDLGTAAAPPVAAGTPGSFNARSGPDYLRVAPAGDGLITADSTIAQWCAAAACAAACAANYCSNADAKIMAKPEFVKLNTGSGPVALENVADDTIPAAGQWSWDSANNRIMMYDDPNTGSAIVTATMNGQSEMVCVRIMDACDDTIETGVWMSAEVSLTLSDAPNSGKTIARNEADATRGFDSLAIPATTALLSEPYNTEIKGNLKNGAACVTLTAASMPDDDPQSPIKITPAYFGTTPLAHTSGEDRPGFVLIRPTAGVASGTTSFAGITSVQDAFISTPEIATMSIVLSPVWRQDGGKLLFVSRQSSPCDGAAATGTQPFTDFNLYTMDLTGDTLGNCVRLTRNSTDGIGNTGVAPYSEVAWSTSNDKAVFAAQDLMGTGITKLFWVGATATAGMYVGVQYDYPPAGPVADNMTIYEDAMAGQDTITVPLNDFMTMSPGSEVILYEEDPFDGGIIRRETATVAAIDNDVTNALTRIRLTAPLKKSYTGMMSGGSSYIEYPVTLRRLGQNIVPLNDEAEWLDPHWSGNYAECDANFRDKLIAVRAPKTGNVEEDYVCNPACTTDTGSTINANIVMIDGAKDADGMYRIDGKTSNLKRVTQFSGNAVWPIKPRWSPDCKMIAFLAWDRTPDVDFPTAPSKTSVYVINLAETSNGFVTASLPVTSLDAPGVYKIYDYASHTMPAYVPNWSADGKLVSYSVDKRNRLDIQQINQGMDSIVDQLFGGSDHDSYLEYMPDQPKSQGEIYSPQIVGRVDYNELYLTQCPSHAGSVCPNKPNTPYAQVSQMSAGAGSYLRLLTIENESVVGQGGGILFQDGIVTAVFPPNVIASDTVFYNTNPTAYCGGGSGPGPNCPADPTNEYIVNAGEAREYFPDGTNFSSYIRLIFHYCDDDNDGKVDAGTESINAATGNGTKSFTYDAITGNCYIDGAPTSGGTVDVDSLGVYNWVTASNSWVRMDGATDKTAKTITIYSTHFSRYDTLGFKMGFAPDAVLPLQLNDIHTYPNPYVASANRMDGIRFAASGLNQGNVTISIKVYDLRGSFVTTLAGVVPSDYDTSPAVNENGAFTLLRWNPVTNASGRPLASGVYVYYMVARTAHGYEITHTGKFSVVR